eukprot:scaffold119890_cov78-Phaeocystis_antarctica.AAC.1
MALPHTPALHPRLSTPDYRPTPLVAPRLAIAALCAHWPSRTTAVHTFVQLLHTFRPHSVPRYHAHR